MSAGAPERLWYGRGPTAALLRTVLAPASVVFGGAVAARTALYDRGLFPSARASVPVISVGGLRVGGAGKTPFVLWLVGRLAAHGLRPCIVSSGYGAAAPSTCAFVLDAASATAPGAVARAGDEAVFLALRSGAPVVVGRDRFAACEFASRQLAAGGRAADVFVLDDGFQHRALARDLDVVLLSGSESSEWLLPAGPLREGPGALSRADVLVTVGQGAADPSAGDAPRSPGARSTRALSLVARTRVSSIVSMVEDSVGESPDILADRAVVAVAGIARPERFLADLERLGARIVGRVLRRDHHHYGDDDRREIEVLAKGADLVATTEKDLVKLSPMASGLAIRALRIEMDVPGEDALLERIRAIVPFDR